MSPILSEPAPHVGIVKNTTPSSAKASATSALECPVVILGCRSR
jgi:hypothetical protein